MRGSKKIGLKKIANAAADLCPGLDTMFVYKYTGLEGVAMKEVRSNNIS
jgi:hypothetical protein